MNALHDIARAQGAQQSALFCIEHKQGNAFTILKNFQRNALIKTCSLIHCNLKVYSYS